MEMEDRIISYREYRELLNKEILLEAIIRDIRYLVDEAELNYNGEDLRLDDNIKMLAKKYIKYDYKRRISDLKMKESVKNNESNR